MDTNIFLRAVLGNAGHYCLFASNSTTSKRIQRFYEDVDVLIEEGHSLDEVGFDVYFALAAFKENVSKR